MGLADRVIVMQEGRIVAEFARGGPDWIAESDRRCGHRRAGRTCWPHEHSSCDIAKQFSA